MPPVAPYLSPCHSYGYFLPQSTRLLPYYKGGKRQLGMRRSDSPAPGMLWLRSIADPSRDANAKIEFPFPYSCVVWSQPSLLSLQPVLPRRDRSAQSFQVFRSCCCAVPGLAVRSLSNL